MDKWAKVYEIFKDSLKVNEVNIPVRMDYENMNSFKSFGASHYDVGSPTIGGVRFESFLQSMGTYLQRRQVFAGNR